MQLALQFYDCVLGGDCPSDLCQAAERCLLLDAGWTDADEPPAPMDEPQTSTNEAFLPSWESVTFGVS